MSVCVCVTRPFSAGLVKWIWLLNIQEPNLTVLKTQYELMTTISVIPPCYFWRQGLSLILKLVVSSRVTGQWDLRIYPVLSPNQYHWLQAHRDTLVFMWTLVVTIQVFKLAQQEPYPLNHLTSSFVWDLMITNSETGLHMYFRGWRFCKIMELLINQENGSHDWRGGTVVKSSDCALKGLGFNFQIPFDSFHQSVAPVPECSSVLRGNQACIWCTVRHAQHSNTLNLLKLFFIKENGLQD